MRESLDSRKMRKLQEIAVNLLSPSPLDVADGGSDRDSRLSSWPFDCHGLWYNLALVVPSAIFVVYLLVQARKNFTKLFPGRSFIMIAYYALLWFVTILNLVWCALQAWQCTPGKEIAWNLLSLFTASGMLFLEISLVAFLLQENYASGLKALTHTFLISGIIVGMDILLKIICVFGFGVPLFVDNGETHRVKWGLWVVHKLLLTAVYGFILSMRHTKWRERLPARPAFHNYIFMMFLLNAVALFASSLAANEAGFGFWLYNLTTICYHSLYLPFLYVVFLADFFQEEDFHLENVYYAEMKDAGFLDDTDWD